MKIPHPNHPEGGYYMEEALYTNLAALPARINKDKDILGVIVGSPGDGKSTLVQQIAYPLDASFSIDSIKWSYEDYVKHSIGLYNKGQSRGKAVVHDEGKEALSAVSVMSRRTKRFMDFLYENRQMNMYQFILTGDFFDLPKSIVMQRVMFMIWVHEEGEFDNGYFKFFNREGLRRLYILGKKERNMAAAPYVFRGRFSRFYTVDEKKYRAQKHEHLTIERYIDSPMAKKLTKKEVAFMIWTINPEATNSMVSHILNVNDGTVSTYHTEFLQQSYEEQVNEKEEDSPQPAFNLSPVPLLLKGYEKRKFPMPSPLV